MLPLVFLSVHRDHDGKVTPEEVAAAAMYLKDTIGKEGAQELISNLSRDKGYLYNVCFESIKPHVILLTCNPLLVQTGRFLSKTL